MKLIFKHIIFWIAGILLLVALAFLVFDWQSLQNFRQNYAAESLFFFIAVVLISGTSTFFLQRTILSPIKRLSTFVQQLTKEEKSQKLTLQIRRKDEIGTLNRKLTQLAERIWGVDQYMKKIEKGQISVNDETAEKIPGSEKLNFILFQIKEKDALIARLQDENSKSLWHREGVSRLYTLIQKSTADFDDFLNDLILFLAEYTAIPQAGLFITEPSGEKQILRLRACRAYDQKKQIDEICELGEGLPGRAAREQKVIHIDNLPEGYSYIASGLGEQSVKHILLAPIIYNKATLGVFEFMSPEQIEPHTKSFLTAVADRISSEIFIRKTQTIQ